MVRGRSLLRDQPAAGRADMRAKQLDGISSATYWLVLANAAAWTAWSLLTGEYAAGIPALVNGPVAIVILHRLLANRHTARRSQFDTEIRASAPARVTDTRRQSPPSNRSGHAAHHRARRRATIRHRDGSLPRRPHGIQIADHGAVGLPQCHRHRADGTVAYAGELWRLESSRAASGPLTGRRVSALRWTADRGAGPIPARFSLP